MSSAVKSKAQCEKLFLSKIRKQYNDTKNFDNAMIAGHAMDFKGQQHTNTFEELLESWEEYRDDHGAEEENLEEENQDLPVLPELTKQRTTDDPDTVESLILERHIYEMLYNILLASHYQMKQRKTKLLNELYEQVTVKQNKKKRSEIIAKYLPNHKSMEKVIKDIYKEIVQKHYHKSKVFTDLKKQTIITYIEEACTLSFEMLMAKNELSFFPLLFTDQSSSYIAPVVRYDKIIKKNEKKNQSLDNSSFLQIIKTKKAECGFVEGRHQRSYSSIKAAQILYYTFPGVIVTDKNKVLERAETFTYDDPSIFLRHDLNWIFTDKYFRERKMTKYKRDKSVEPESDDDNIFTSADNYKDPYHEIASVVPKTTEMAMTAVKENNDIIQNRDFIGKAQLIQDWAMLKRQKVDQLCEELCELIMENMWKDEEEEEVDDVDSKAAEDDDDDDDEEGEDDEYKCNKVACKLLYDLIMKSREGMKLKMQRSHLNDKDNISYLNMTKLYKHFSNNQCKTENNTQQKKKVDIKHGYIVKRIVNSVFDAVIDDKNGGYSNYEFLKTNTKINQKLHEFIAISCELICNIFHHEWDLCPINVIGNKSLITFDDRIHIKDGNLSMEDSQTKIDYCSFPGIIAKSCWHQFDSQISKNQIDEDQINKVLKYRMWACLNDEE